MSLSLKKLSSSLDPPQLPFLRILVCRNKLNQMLFIAYFRSKHISLRASVLRSNVHCPPPDIAASVSTDIRCNNLRKPLQGMWCIITAFSQTLVGTYLPLVSTL